MSQERFLHERGTGKPWILFPYKSRKSEIALLNFETFTAMTLKLQEVAKLGMFFHVKQTIHFIHVCGR